MHQQVTMQKWDSKEERCCGCHLLCSLHCWMIIFNIVLGWSNYEKNFSSGVRTDISHHWTGFFWGGSMAGRIIEWVQPLSWSSMLARHNFFNLCLHIISKEIIANDTKFTWQSTVKNKYHVIMLILRIHDTKSFFRHQWIK